MKIVAVKQTVSGQNIHFISDEFSEYTLEDLLALGEKIPIENIKIFTPKTGRKAVRLKANQSTLDNLGKEEIGRFHAFMRLYKRDFKLVVKYN